MAAQGPRAARQERRVRAGGTRREGRGSRGTEVKVRHCAEALCCQAAWLSVSGAAEPGACPGRVLGVPARQGVAWELQL